MAKFAGVSGSDRLVSLDAYRGFVMLAMASAGLGLGTLAARRPDDPWIQFLALQTEHVTWRGCTFWDLIQPSFLFIVGVAMPFSYAIRTARGESFGRQLGHAVWRSLLLVALGVFLSSAWSPRTNFVFTNVLCQIGLGYPFVFLLASGRPWVQVLAIAAILVGDWALFALYPADPRNFPTGGDFELALRESLTGFRLHWARHINAGAAVDGWLLNLFPRPDGKPYLLNEGGYTTLNFVPSMATMLMGVLAGKLLRSEEVRPVARVQYLLIAGALMLAVGTLLDQTICPSVKRLWTPSWTIYSAGWTSWLLAIFYGAIDVAGLRRLAFPLVVVGVNSIAFYVMAQLMKPWVAGQLKIHGAMALEFAQRLGIMKADPSGKPLVPFSGEFGPVEQSAAVLGALWLIAYAMYRQRIFVRF